MSKLLQYKERMSSGYTTLTRHTMSLGEQCLNSCT